MSALLAETPGLTILEGAAEDLLLDRAGRVCGLVLGDGRRIASSRIVLTTGTFLAGSFISGRRKSRPAGSARRRRSACRRPCGAAALPSGG